MCSNWISKEGFTNLPGSVGQSRDPQVQLVLPKSSALNGRQDH